jgi:hypothetical protein
MAAGTKVQLGTLIEATLKPEDLIPAFHDELVRLSGGNDHLVVKEAFDLMAEWGTETPDWTVPEHELMSEVLNDLQDALQEYAPVFCYFGAIEGDGADFGFWMDSQAFEEARQYAEVWDQDSEYAFSEDNGVWIHVNDHGNIAILTDNNGEPGEIIWDAV